MEHASVSWIQIPVKNLARAAKFYEEVFGAAFFYETLNGKPHALFGKNISGKTLLNGTLVEIDAHEELGLGTVLFFDATGNFESIMSLIEENGGKITHKKTLITNPANEGGSFIPNTYIDNKPGYFAHFTDCEGNKMALYGSN